MSPLNTTKGPQWRDTFSGLKSGNSEKPGDDTELLLFASADVEDTQSLNQSPSQPLTQTPLRMRQRDDGCKFFSGWRGGVVACVLAAFFVLIVNTIATISFWKKFGAHGGAVVMFEGSCSEVKELNRWIHLAINVTSTVLLGCSNYCMQSISAPTRDELVKAHNRKQWVHIGVQSIRNLFYIGRDRALLWLLLFSSSVPLHLLFNSVIFSSLQGNQYTILPATQAFLEDKAWGVSALIDVPTNMSDPIVSNAAQLRHKFDNGLNHTKLTTEDCFRAYTNQYVSSVGDAILIQDEVIWHNPNIWKTQWTNDSFYNWTRRDFHKQDPQKQDPPKQDPPLWDDKIPFQSSPQLYPSNGWRCPSRNISNCDPKNPAEVSNVSTWAPYGSPVKYCIVELVNEKCKLQFSLPIAVAVIVCNSIKLLCMAFILWRCRGVYLVTLGDAIASFLQEPDPETKGRCLHTRELMICEWHWMDIHGLLDPKHVNVESEVYQPYRQRWARAADKRRWAFTYFLYISALICAIAFIRRSLNGMPSKPKQLWQTGIGTLIGNNLLDMQVSIIGGTILANVPQALLSYFYLLFNSVITCMFVGEEWTHYYLSRKPLRVSSPIGQQRSTYWLQVPYKYSLPLTVLSGLLHWLASQSLFMVQINVLDNGSPRKVDDGQFISTCGYSPIAIILTTIIGSVIVIGGTGLSWRRYPAGMPLAGSCSAVISAACHPPKDDMDAALLPVQWGVVEVAADGHMEIQQENIVGHCSFTSYDVTQPKSGKLYR